MQAYLVGRTYEKKRVTLKFRDLFAESSNPARFLYPAKSRDVGK